MRDGRDASAVRAGRRSRRPILAAAACWHGGCSNAACGSCSCSPAARSAARAATGTGTKTWSQNHGQEAGRIDQPVAALLKDLRRRGMLDDTLVLVYHRVWPHAVHAIGRRRGRQGPRSQPIRLHVWMAGAGLRHGIAYGATDDFGYRAVEKPVHWHDFHATVLHLLGIDHERLTYYHNGIRRRLTNVHGHVVQALLA